MKDSESAQTSCPECGCSEGELHKWGCGLECCPFCKGRMCSAHDCPDEHFNYYNEDDDSRWGIACEKKGRFPHIHIPLYCARCGQEWPEFFNDPEWDKVIAPANRELILCLDCYALIKNKFRPGAMWFVKKLGGKLEGRLEAIADEMIAEV